MPAVKDGQLRCQKCAQGVQGKARFCGKCTVTTCRSCGSTSPKPLKGGRASVAKCDKCPDVTKCLNCGHTVPRTKGKHRELAVCDECPIDKTTTCRNCGSVRARKEGVAIVTKRCEDCPS